MSEQNHVQNISFVHPHVRAEDVRALKDDLRLLLEENRDLICAVELVSGPFQVGAAGRESAAAERSVNAPRQEGPPFQSGALQTPALTRAESPLQVH